MDITNMSAEERSQEQARLAEATALAKTAAQTAKAAVTECKAAVKAAKAEEKAAAEKALKDAESVAKAATADVTKATAQEKEFIKAVEALARTADPFVALAMDYAKVYPTCKAFHITSDMQVFLEGDGNLRLARLHQRSLKEGEVQTVNIE